MALMTADASRPASGETAPTAAQVAALLEQARQLVDGNDSARALELLGEVLAMSAHLEDLPLQIRAAALASALRMRQGDHREAARLAETARALARQAGQVGLMAEAQVAMARVAASLGENDAALADLEAAWPVVQQGPAGMLRFDCENLLGFVLYQLGQLEPSLEWHRRAEATAGQAGLHHVETLAAANAAARWLDIGDQREAAGQASAAREAWQKAEVANDDVLRQARRFNPVQAAWLAIANRSAAQLRLGRGDEALAGFAEAGWLLSESGYEVGRVRLINEWAAALFRLGDMVAARQQVHQGLELAEACGDRNVQASLLELASRIAEADGDFALALGHHKRFHALRSQIVLDRAQERSQMLAVRLDTERAMAEAAAERGRAEALALANRELAHRAESLSREAELDALTGLANRRRLDAYLARHHADARLRHVPLCVAMVDVDHFKRVNDHYSHVVGDSVLRTLAGLLTAQCRPRDLAARFGGEEFVIVIGEVGPRRAAAVCERLREVVQAHDWTSIAQGLAVTVSIGMADLAAAPEVVTGLAAADAQLYRAKREGRNRLAWVDSQPELFDIKAAQEGLW